MQAMLARMLRSWAVSLLTVGALASGAGATPPLWTEDPLPLPEGQAAVRLGGDFALVSSGENRFRLPSLYWETGLGGLADGIVLFNLGEVTEDGKAKGYDVEKLVLAGKILLHRRHDGWPQAAVGFGVKIPSEDTTKGLGSDTTDFYGRLLLGENIGRARVLVNLGLGLLEKTSELHGQDDVLEYGIALEEPVSERTALLLEWNGHTYSTRQPAQSFALVGIRLMNGHGCGWDLAGIWGLRPDAEHFRITLGYTFTAELFRETTPSAPQENHAAVTEHTESDHPLAGAAEGAGE